MRRVYCGATPTLEGVPTPMNNCGQSAHQPECLCDVVIVQATPINYGLTDVWHGEAIARALNVGVPWKSSDLVVFGEALLKAYDIWSRQERRGETIEGEVIRIKVCDLLRTGESMTDVARILHLDWKTVISAMTNGQPSTVWSWDEDQWRSAEAIIYDDFANHSKAELAMMLGIKQVWYEGHGFAPPDVLDKLADWYGVKINENGQKRLDVLKQILRDGAHPVDAVAHAADLGYEATAKQCYMIRKRLSERGEVASVLPKRKVAA